MKIELDVFGAIFANQGNADLKKKGSDSGEPRVCTLVYR
jgi:hypothetical protein